ESRKRPFGTHRGQEHLVSQEESGPPTTEQRRRGRCLSPLFPLRSRRGDHGPGAEKIFQSSQTSSSIACSAAGGSPASPAEPPETAYSATTARKIRMNVGFAVVRKLADCAADSRPYCSASIACETGGSPVTAGSRIRFSRMCQITSRDCSMHVRRVRR